MVEFIFKAKCRKTLFGLSNVICDFCSDKTNEYIKFFKRGKSTFKPAYLLINIIAWDKEQDLETNICKYCFQESKRNLREELFFTFQEPIRGLWNKCYFCNQKGVNDLYVLNNVCYECFCFAPDNLLKEDLILYITKENGMNLTKDDLKNKIFNHIDWGYLNSKQASEFYDDYLDSLLKYDVYVIDEAWCDDKEACLKLKIANEKINELGIKTEIKTNEEFQKLFPQIYNE